MVLSQTAKLNPTQPVSKLVDAMECQPGQKIDKSDFSRKAVHWVPFASWQRQQNQHLPAVS